LLQLKYVDAAISTRKEISKRYREALANTQGIRCLPESQAERSNYAYFPIRVEGGYAIDRDELYEKLREQNIFARRYFYPLISNFPMYRGLPSARPEHLPVATRAANEILCLPIYPALGIGEQQCVIDTICST
jgi:dTDP-4-amino-4,6-dideoxygalactose transaminase